MDYIISKITDYVLVLNPSISRNDFLDLIVKGVVDRVLVYTNRVQLLKEYEEDVLVSGFDFDDYDEELRPIPKQLMIPLATIVIEVYKATLAQDASSTTASPVLQKKRIKDQGQEVEYTDATITYLATKTDEAIFRGLATQLDNYRLVKVPYDHEYSTGFYNCYWR